jgi:transcriptional regulator with GAF, ATPase, and Fis domain
MNDLASIEAKTGAETDRVKIANLAFFAHISSSPGDSYEKLPRPMIETSAQRDVTALTEAANAIAPMAMFGTIRRGSDNRVVMRYWRPKGFGAHRFEAAALPAMLLPEAVGVLQVSSDEMRIPGREALDAILGFMNIGRTVTIPSHHSPAVRFWMGLLDPGVLDDDRLQRFVALSEFASSVLIGSDPSASERERLQRLEGAAELLPELFKVLDIRKIFGRVSEIARKVLPHDVVGLGMYNDDFSEMTLYACSCSMPVGDPVVVKNEYPVVSTRVWDHHVHHDLSADAVERDTDACRAGYRSSLRIPIRFGDRLIGGLNFMTYEPGKYTPLDVAVARRISEYVSLALSHHRMAEEVRLAEEVRARAANVELLDSLLAEVADSGDLPDVIGRISTMAQKVLPHDAMLVPVVLPNGTHVRVVAGTLPGGATYPETAEIPPHLRSTDWEYDIVDDAHADPIQRNLPSARLGLRSSLRIPIKFEGKLAAALVFLSFTPGYYTQKDVLIARRIADRLALGLSRDSREAARKRADEADRRASHLESRVRALTEELDARTGYRRVVGDSYAWREVLTQATQVAPTDATALLLGESGTGKEVVARFIHRASPRRDGPFVAINCAALPEQLLEAELFGYERGAFTGATQSKPGQLEQAGGGTLFLDEVAEMSPSAQAKFLRVLQEREFQRLGGTRVLRTDARIIAATHQNLPASIERGQFREDLYYRLNVFAIQLPPLRERREDILALSDAFLGEIGKGLGRPPAGISREARVRLLDYHWPGNVRELRNVLERAAILCDGGLVLPEHLALPIPAPPRHQAPAMVSDLVVSRPAPMAPPVTAARSANDIRSIERTMIENALRDARFNKSKAAAILGLTRAQLYGRMRRYGLD